MRCINSVTVWVKIVLLSALFFISSADLGRTECKYKFVPGISLEETYDSNIFLSHDDEVWDLITVLSPSISWNADCKQKGINLYYEPGFAFYDKHSEYNTVRHNANVGAYYQLAEHFRLDLGDTFYRSEEPREPGVNTTIVRQSRYAWYRNAGNAQISYQYGPKENIYAGYTDNYLNNSDPTLENTRIYGPTAGFNYWFSRQNGIELSGTYSKGIHDITPDFRQQIETVRLVHLYTQQKSLAFTYSHTFMDYDPGRPDYRIHDFGATYSLGIDAHTGVVAGLGYYIYNPSGQSSNDGLSFQAGLKRAFENGSFSLDGAGGYRQEISEAENLGFAKFYSFGAEFTYLLARNLTALGKIGFIRERFIELLSNRLDKQWLVLAGIQHTYHKWLTISFTGQQTQLDSDIDAYDNKDNRIVLRITAIYN